MAANNIDYMSRKHLAAYVAVNEKKAIFDKVNSFLPPMTANIKPGFALVLIVCRPRGGEQNQAHWLGQYAFSAAYVAVNYATH